MYANKGKKALTIKMYELWLICLYDLQNPEHDAAWGSEDLTTNAEFINSTWSLDGAINLKNKLSKDDIYSDNIIQKLVVVESNSTKKLYYGIP